VIIGISVETIKGILIRLKEEKYEEPTPHISEGDIGKLASSLKTPFQRPDISDPRKNFCNKSAWLFFLISQNHCFPNGNKRLAVTSLITLCTINDFELEISEVTLYAYSIAVTLLSKYRLIDTAVSEVCQLLEDNIVEKKSKLKPEQKQDLEIEFQKFLITRI
jgi:prophage maintenance system killer protein